MKNVDFGFAQHSKTLSFCSSFSHSHKIAANHLHMKYTRVLKLYSHTFAFEMHKQFRRAGSESKIGLFLTMFTQMIDKSV